MERRLGVMGRRRVSRMDRKLVLERFNRIEKKRAQHQSPLLDKTPTPPPKNPPAGNLWMKTYEGRLSVV